MNKDEASLGEPMLLHLTQRQQDVLRVLQSRENERYPLSQWYLGTLYALANHHNPDRISQAAQSLRELVEKLPRVVLESDPQVNSYNVPENRREIAARIAKDQQRYPEGWAGKLIDPQLGETFEKASIYFEKSQQPSRREQVQMAVVGIDPMANQLDVEILRLKGDRIYRVWQQFEKLAHHGGNPDVREFTNWLEVLEQEILDLLAPVTAQDQQEIRSILEGTDQTDSDVERLFALMERRGANYTFFFDQATDPSWIPHLKEKGYFSNPPSMEREGEGQGNAPYWWPLHYLSRVAHRDQDTVVEILQQLPDVDNLRIKLKILEIARQLPGVQSAKLKSKVLDIGEWELPFLDHWYSELLTHWVKENETDAALELADVLVQFEPDPRLEYKRNWYLEEGLDFNPPVEPVPKLRYWEYRRMFEKGVRPLAETEPYAVACILANAAGKMIRLRTQEESQDERSDEDCSEVWCRRLGWIDDTYEESSNVLIEGLTYACERVFEEDAGSVQDLDGFLRGHHWKFFKRLRQHLYARFPNEETKPWIREFILEKEDYSLWRHHYEFQRMVQSACEQIGEELLTEEERIAVSEAILSGPPRERFLEQWGDEFTEELFERRKRYFHQMQFKPFSSTLFGMYADYFQDLQNDGGQNISDDSYLLFGDVRALDVLPQSPLSPERLSKFTDLELLDYINEWDEEYSYESQGSGDSSFVEVNIEALADVFKSVFREYIMLDDDKFRFWLDHLKAIERTIYVRAIVVGLEEYLKQGKLDRIGDSLTVCEWVLSHPDDDPADGFRQGEQSRNGSHWRNSRRAVCDFVETCVKEESNLPIIFNEQLAKLLDMLCTQSDWRLDNNNQPFRVDRFDPHGEAINNTRSRALRSLIQFGLWLKNQDPGADTSFVTMTLEKRFAPDAEFPLTLPEYSILGRSFPRMLGLDSAWTAEHESDLFPQLDTAGWCAAFGSLLFFTRPREQVFEALRSQFGFATENLPYPEAEGNPRASITDKLGQHLFIYYLLGRYPLKGETSLLDQFFRKTSGEPERWGALFHHVGLILRNTQHLDQDRRDSFISFFEWRLAQGQAHELKEFWFWLESECFDAEWRLDAFSKTLDIGQPEGTKIYSEVKKLSEFLPDHAGRVVECFSKLTDNAGNDTSNIQTEPAKSILRVGLESAEEDVRQNAQRAHDNLLRRGRSDLLDLGN